MAIFKTDYVLFIFSSQSSQSSPEPQSQTFTKWIVCIEVRRNKNLISGEITVADGVTISQSGAIEGLNVIIPVCHLGNPLNQTCELQFDGRTDAGTRYITSNQQGSNNHKVLI